MDSKDNIIENDYLDEIEDNQDLTKQDLILIKLGKEYRNNYAKNKKKIMQTTIITCICILVIGISISIALYQSGLLSYLFFFLFATAVATIFFAFNYKTEVKKLDEDLKNDDKMLGFKHRLKNKHVKGSAKAKLKPRLLATISIFISALFMGLISLGIFAASRLTSKENLVPISGNLEYAEEIKSGIIFGIKDNNTEYRITSYATKYFNELFWDKNEVSLGDPITVYVDSTEEIRNTKTKDKENWTYIYTVIVNDKEYFTYDNYLEGYNSNKQLGIIMSIVSLIVSAGFGVGIIVSVIIYKKNSKNEDIEI